MRLGDLNWLTALASFASPYFAVVVLFHKLVVIYGYMLRSGDYVDTDDVRIFGGCKK